MNTKTMRLPPRRALTSNKRRDTTEAEPSTTPKRLKPPVQSQPSGSNRDSDSALFSSVSSSNQLLAGYLAHEFLTRGTLFGQRWNPVESEAVEGLSCSDSKVKQSIEGEGEGEGELNQVEEKLNGYVEVANLLNRGGAHLPGIINPAQLAQFLRL